MSPGPRNQRARVALISSSYYPHFGGVEEHVRNVAHALGQSSEACVVWTVARAGRGRTFEHEGTVVRELPAPLPARTLPALLRFSVLGPLALLSWLRAYAADRPSVLHVHCFGPNATYARWLGRLVRRPVVLSVHGESMADEHGVLDASEFQRWSLRRGLVTARRVTGCSQASLDDLARFGSVPEDAEVVFNGIDLDETVDDGSSSVELPPRYVLAVGRVVPQKGFDLLLDAWARVDPLGVALVIAGDGSQMGALMARAAELPPTHTVHFTGRLARGQVVDVMARAEVLVIPSRIEPFGIVVLEGWRAETAVVVTRHGGPPEFVRDGIDALVVDPHDPSALARTLADLIADPARRSRLASAGRRRVNAFSWNGVVRAYECIYNDVAASSNRSSSGAGRRR